LAGEVTGFRPTIMMGFIKMFNAKRVLDFSSGWADRLVAAMAANVYYVGIDPNSCLHPKYQEAINHFATQPKNYVMIESPFETAELPKGVTFDLVLTSPPYHKMEIYSNDPGQSVNNRDLNEWFDDFLMFSLIKAWKVLESKGHMVIIINDIYKVANYTEKMVEIFTKITKDATFLGVISYSEFENNKPKSVQPTFLWKKN
jgi:tRNA1(Val) A37 N6-methylase TrmN6